MPPVCPAPPARAEPAPPGSAPRPAYVLTAECDPLRDEGEAYAAALAEAGVPVTARRSLGSIHGFWRLPASVDAGHGAIAEVAGLLHALT